MSLNIAYYNLFMRNWKNNKATENDIDAAVRLAYITEDQGKTIKSTERNVKQPL